MLILLLFCFVYVEAAKKLPPYVQQCYRNDPNLSKCIEKNVEMLQPKLINGIAELKIPNLNPYPLPATQLFWNNLELNMSNIQAYNINDYKVKSIIFNYEERTWDMEWIIREVRIETDYAIRGKIMVFELNTGGKFEGTFRELSEKYTGTFDIVDKKGKEYLKVKSTDLKAKSKSERFHFTNVFKDDELNTRANEILNENADLITDEVFPAVLKLVKLPVDNVFIQLLETYPADVLFPVKK
ncbi:unnamed protein product [Phyllotreta striolata]|uniref:Uncharacterized protein n=1 Tax=Phyllotreta striolata TaxID=444603 RepID=A0A9N9TV67_PHYSR|nr:unnamed protein product [Phyllotreta striolata]